MSKAIAITATTLAIGALGLTSTPAAGTSGGPGADSSARQCDLSANETTQLGASYVFPFKVKNIKCGEAKGVIKAFHACRKSNGGADGRCNSKVAGFKCNEGPRNEVPGVQYEANVRCKKGDQRIIHRYSMLL